MKRLRFIITVTLAVAIAVICPMQALAASRVNYISELRLGYGDSGKAALANEGFTVWTNINANEGGNGSAVWIGYKTTTDVSEAITDIAVMNMKGGYSFDAYSAELNELNRKVSEQLNNFDATIKEFRANYEDGNPFAEKALEVMNLFTDDDTLDANGAPVAIGDILLDENTTDETLHRIFLEGNSEAISAIETALAAACIETSDDNVLNRLEESEYPNRLDPAGNAGRSNIKAAFDEFHSAALSAQQVYEDANNYDGGAEEFLDRDTLSDEEVCAYVTQLSYYELLDGIEFGDSGMTLLEFALLDDEVENENGEVLEDEYLDMMAQAMTPGQLGIVASVGIMTVLLNASAYDMSDELDDMFDEYTDLDEQEKISVFYGVDRTLFSDIESVALTSTALREKAAAEANNFGKDSGADKTTAIALSAAAAASFTLGAIVSTIGLRTLVVMGKDVLTEFAFDAMEGFVVAQGEATAASSVVFGGILTAIGVIAIIAAVVLTIFAILKWIEKPVVPKTEYTQIPRVIVDKLDNNEGYINYYAAKLAGAAENETDSTKLYGDLNSLNGSDEWVALYYTKNPNKGTPLTDEIVVSTTSMLNTSKAEYYTPIHMFGSNTAANLNQYNTKSGAKTIYIFFRNTNDTYGQVGSVFGEGTVAVTVAAFLGGAILAAAVTYIVMKKKRPAAAV